MMVFERNHRAYSNTKFLQAAFETFRLSDSAKSDRLLSLYTIQIHAETCLRSSKRSDGERARKKICIRVKPDLFLKLLNIHIRLHFCEKDCAGPFQGTQCISPVARRQYRHAEWRTSCINQHNIQIAMKRAMLKAVVQYDGLSI